MSNAPTLPGWATSDGCQIEVWCIHCTRWHIHGRHAPATGCHFDGTHRHRCTCPVGAGDGHRVAHCDSNSSPYYDPGYVVAETTGKIPGICSYGRRDGGRCHRRLRPYEIVCGQHERVFTCY